MAKQGTVTATGGSGRQYVFDVYPWDDLDVPKGTAFSPVGAVYLVLRKIAQGNYDILYVGQTANLTGRFDDHHKQACFDRNARTHIGVLRCGQERDRLAIEADLLNRYKTVCNF
jgi:hypothetical protein